MTRDLYKSEAYFEDIKKRNHLDIVNYKTTYQRKKQEKGEAYQGFAMVPLIFSSIYIYVHAAYSKGDEVSSLVSPYSDMLSWYNKSWKKEGDYSDGGDKAYSQLLTIISLGILLLDKEGLSDLYKVIKEVKYEDYLIRFMFKYIDANAVFPDKLLWPEDKGCQKLKKITESSKQGAESELKDYLENDFYTKENLETEYNSHKKVMVNMMAIGVLKLQP